MTTRDFIILRKSENPNDFISLQGNRWIAPTIYQGGDVVVHLQIQKVLTSNFSIINSFSLFVSFEMLVSATNILSPESNNTHLRITNAFSQNSLINIGNNLNKIWLEGRFVTNAPDLITF
jgi:hypothetical protein